MTSLGNIAETALYELYGENGTNETNERKKKMVDFLRERLLEYYRQKIIYYQSEVVFWTGDNVFRGEIPDEVVKSILLDLEWEMKRKNI